jgi:hypothetical protein
VLGLHQWCLVVDAGGLCCNELCFGLDVLYVQTRKRVSAGEKRFRVKALPRPSVGAGDGGVFKRCSPPWRHHRGALVPLPTTLAWAIRVKTQAPVSGAGDGGVFITSLSRASLWRVDGLLLRATSLSSGLVDVGAAAPDGCCTPRRQPRKAMRLWLNGLELRLAWLGWQPCAALWRGCRLGRHVSEETF